MPSFEAIWMTWVAILYFWHPLYAALCGPLPLEHFELSLLEQDLNECPPAHFGHVSLPRHDFATWLKPWHFMQLVAVGTCSRTFYRMKPIVTWSGSTWSSKIKRIEFVRLIFSLSCPFSPISILHFVSWRMSSTSTSSVTWAWHQWWHLKQLCPPPSLPFVDQRLVGYTLFQYRPTI